MNLFRVNTGIRDLIAFALMYWCLFVCLELDVPVLVALGGEPYVYFGQSEFWEPFMAQSHEEHCAMCNW